MRASHAQQQKARPQLPAAFAGFLDIGLRLLGVVLHVLIGQRQHCVDVVPPPEPVFAPQSRGMPLSNLSGQNGAGETVAQLGRGQQGHGVRMIVKTLH